VILFCFFLISPLFLCSSELKQNLWNPTEFVWNLGLASLCDAGVDRDPFRYFQGSMNHPSFEWQDNDRVIWMRGVFVSHFCRHILPNLKKSLVVVIGDGDSSFPSECIDSNEMNQLIQDERVIHIFAQNCDYKGNSDKVTPIPIGIDFHTVAFRQEGIWEERGSPKEQETVLKEILLTLKPTSLRKPSAFVDFHLQDTMRTGFCQRFLSCGEDRTIIFNRLRNRLELDNAKAPMKRSDLWRTKGEYAFSISPHGNGLDCHRTWEDLVLGCIVIVKTSALDSLYEGLPVVIVKDWDEITESNMAKWLNQYKDAFTNPTYREKLTNGYWINKIKEKIK
jgi:hypothetical protein